MQIFENHRRLAPIGRNDHNARALAAGQERRPIKETGQIGRDQRQDQAFAAAPADDQRNLEIAGRRRRAPARAWLEEREPGLVERQSEHHAKEDKPRRPGRPFEPVREQVRILANIDDRKNRPGFDTRLGLSLINASGLGSSNVHLSHPVAGWCARGRAWLRDRGYSVPPPASSCWRGSRRECAAPHC